MILNNQIGWPETKRGDKVIIKQYNQLTIYEIYLYQVISLILAIVLAWLRIDWGTTDWAHRVKYRDKTTMIIMIMILNWASKTGLDPTFPHF